MTKVQWVSLETENSVTIATVKHLGLILRWGIQQVFK